MPRRAKLSNAIRPTRADRELLNHINLKIGPVTLNRRKSLPVEVESHLKPFREKVEESEASLRRRLPTRDDVRRIQSAMTDAEALHTVALSWPTAGLYAFLDLDKRLTAARDRIEGVAGRRAFGAVAEKRDFKLASWFRKNTTVSPESLRQAKRQGRLLRTIGAKAKPRYSVQDATAIWGCDIFLTQA